MPEYLGFYCGSATFPLNMTNVIVSGGYFGQSSFTAPQNISVSGVYFLSSVNWEGSAIIGIQGDNSGNPNGTYVCSGLWKHGSQTTEYISGCQFVNPITLDGQSIYHIIWDNRDNVITTPNLGSTITLRLTQTSGLHANLFGSKFFTWVDSSLASSYSINSGGEWNTIHSSIGIAAGILEQTTGIHILNYNLNSTESTLGGSKFVGVRFRPNTNYNVTDMYSWISAIGANAGSLWCRIEYSGVMAGGLRQQVGSYYFGTPTITTINKSVTPLNTTFIEGSRYYIWLIAPSGTALVVGSRYGLQGRNAATGSASFGLGSFAMIQSTNMGSTVTAVAGNYNPLIYFQISGGALSISDYYLNTEGLNCITYMY